MSYQSDAVMELELESHNMEGNAKSLVFLGQKVKILDSDWHGLEKSSNHSDGCVQSAAS